ncbi:hypothetical protein H1C71_035098, partial [Ictidomys tridecemlineatus]
VCVCVLTLMPVRACTGTGVCTCATSFLTCVRESVPGLKRRGSTQQAGWGCPMSPAAYVGVAQGAYEGAQGEAGAPGLQPSLRAGRLLGEQAEVEGKSWELSCSRNQG